MTALTTLNITEKNANNSLSVTVKVNITKKGVVTTTLSKEDVDKIRSYGIKLPTNRLGNEGYFNSTSFSDLVSQIRKVLKRCLSYKIVEEVPVIKYQLETLCSFAYDKNGNIVPNPSVEWTGNYENGEWRDGTSRLDALNAEPFGFSIYAKPFLKRVIEYGNGETKVEYDRLNTEKGTYAHWLNCVTSISYNRYKPVMEVECNECTSKLFVDMIKSICNISEQVKSFINPEQIKAIAESNEPILLLEIKTKIRQLGAMMNAYQCRFVVSSGQLFFVDDEYAGTVKLTNLDNGESNISFPSCDDGLIINPADKHIK